MGVVWCVVMCFVCGIWDGDAPKEEEEEEEGEEMMRKEGGREERME